MNVRETVVQVIGRVLTDSGRPVPEMADNDTLSDSLHLNSLDLAVTVVGLEQELGVDPFRNETPPVRSFGDLVTLYEQACRQRTM